MIVKYIDRKDDKAKVKTVNLDMEMFLSVVQEKATELESKELDAQYLIINSHLYKAIREKIESMPNFEIDKHSRLKYHYLLVLPSGVLYIDDFLVV